MSILRLWRGVPAARLLPLATSSCSSNSECSYAAAAEALVRLPCCYHWYPAVLPVHFSILADTLFFSAFVRKVFFLYY